MKNDGWTAPNLDQLWERIEQRMGVCPSFFRLAREEPPIAGALFELAEFAYLDNPLPSLFKEQIFTYLSRFCPVRYCVARHCAFLLGRGLVAGDQRAPPLDVAAVQRMFDEPVPDAEALGVALERLEAAAPIVEWPPWESQHGFDLRAACAQIFLHGHQASRWIHALQRLLGRARCEQLVLLIGFIRMAHFWTEVHPELESEHDVSELLREHEALAASLLAASGGPAAALTARLQAELALLRRHEETSRKVRQIADALPAYLVYIDDGERIGFANQAFLDAYGLPEPEAVGAPVREVLGDSVYRSVKPHLGASLRGQDVRLDQRWSTPRHGRRDVDLSVVPDRRADGSIAGCFLLALDVTDRTRIEDDLRQSEARFRTLADNMSQLAWMADEHGWVFWYNKRWYDYTGTTLEEMQGWGWKSVHHPEYVDRVVAHLQRSWDTGEPWEDLFPLRGKDGDYRWFLSRAMPIVDSGGRIVRWFGTNTDVTAQREAEQKLLESDRRKDEYIAMLGHELRNPLAAIRSATELVTVLSAGDPRLERAAAVLDRQSSHMARLIDGLLEVSRIARGKIRLDREPLDLRSVLDRVLEDRREDIESRGLDLSTDFASEPLWVLGDPARLIQVFDNLVGNAIKFTTAPGCIIVTLEKSGDEIVGRVRDTGVGIRPDMLAQVFEPFHQEGDDIARSSGGLGLGLALAKGLVELHRGTVAAHSSGPGAGTELEVRLPATAAPPARRQAQPVEVAPGQLKILIVEDNPDAAQMLSELLRLQGHDVWVAGDGPRALDSLHAEMVDMVLCDLGLPGMSGYELARAIRDDPSLKQTPLVALTGYGQPEDRERSADAGFDAHLTKPVELSALVHLLSGFGRR